MNTLLSEIFKLRNVNKRMTRIQ